MTRYLLVIYHGGENRPKHVPKWRRMFVCRIWIISLWSRNNTKIVHYLVVITYCLIPSLEIFQQYWEVSILLNILW